MDELATTSQGEKPRKTHYDVGLLFRKQQAKGSTPLTGSTFSPRSEAKFRQIGPLTQDFPVVRPQIWKFSLNHA